MHKTWTSIFVSLIILLLILLIHFAFINLFIKVLSKRHISVDSIRLEIPSHFLHWTSFFFNDSFRFLSFFVEKIYCPLLLVHFNMYSIKYISLMLRANRPPSPITIRNRIPFEFTIRLKVISFCVLFDLLHSLGLNSDIAILIGSLKRIAFTFCLLLIWWKWWNI